eukprot:scaffold1824_cov332-Prasinococcus_capsulatus_cf.AAC.5
MKPSHASFDGHWMMIRMAGSSVSSPSSLSWLAVRARYLCRRARVAAEHPAMLDVAREPARALAHLPPYLSTRTCTAGTYGATHSSLDGVASTYE